MHGESGLCTDARLHMFASPMTDFSLETESYEKFYPITPAITETTPVGFLVSNSSPGNLLSFEHSYLEVKCKITKEDGSAAKSGSTNSKVRQIPCYGIEHGERRHI